MITFKQHLALTEELDPDVVATCAYDCSDYFKSVSSKTSSKNAFWRGPSSRGSAVFLKYKPDTLEKVSRELSHRRPVDTNPAVHDALNYQFKEMFGIPYRDGLMVSTSEAQAKEYSMHIAPMIIVPVNGTSACYCPKVKDLYSAFSSVAETFNPDRNVEGIELKAVDKFFDEYHYIAGRNMVKKALNEHVGEVMLFPSSGNEIKFYAFTKSFYFTKLLPEIKHHL